MLATIKKFAIELLQRPNVPYLWQPVADLIKAYLQQWGITPCYEKRLCNFSEGAWWAQNSYAIFVYVRRGKGTIPLTIIDTHLDHPGFVADGKGKVLALGSVGFKRIHQLSSKTPLPVKIFDGFSGVLLGRGRLMPYGPPRAIKPFFLIESDIYVPRNAQVIWDIPFFKQQDGLWKMYAADNQVVTAIALALLHEIITNLNKYKNLNALFVFNYLEEIFEVSATHIALKQSTPFGPIPKDAFLLVLESMQTIPLRQRKWSLKSLIQQRIKEDITTYSRLGVLRNNIEAVSDLYYMLSLPFPEFKKGILIKINDIDVPYGVHFLNQTNFALQRVMKLTQDLNIRFQFTISDGACNGTAYSLFPVSPNVVTLVVPTLYKHNIGDDGGIRTEEVLTRDVENLYTLLEHWFKWAAGYYNVYNDEVDKIYQSAQSLLQPAVTFLASMQKERQSVLRAAYPRLNKGEYFPSSLWDAIKTFYYTLRARLIIE